MREIKLVTSYLDKPAGTIYVEDDEKAAELVKLGRAEYTSPLPVDESKKKSKKAKYSTREMKPESKKKGYKTK